MSELNLGYTIDRSTAKRDAVHIAVAPVVAMCALNPGESIGFVPGSTETVTNTGHKIGIVDPFLDRRVKAGERFWMFLYPNTITALRHEWTHPAWTDLEDAKTPDPASARWLRNFAGDARLSYEELMAGAKRFQETGEDMCDGGKWEGFHAPDEFWDHYEAVTGTKVAGVNRESFFSCAC